MQGFAAAAFRPLPGRYGHKVMETFFQFLDNVEDFIKQCAWQTRRWLTRRPRERRKVARTRLAKAPREDTQNANG